MLYNNRLGIDVLSTSLKPAIADRLLLRLHDAAIIGRGQQALQPHGLAVVNVRAYYTDSHVLVHGIIVFCRVFGKSFNIMTAFFPTNRQPCCKKSILAKVCLGAKRGSMWMLAN